MKKSNLLLLALFVLSAAVFVTAQDDLSVPAGDDLWVTDSTNTYDELNLPAGTFGAGSQAFSGTVYFAGDPASGNGYDTSISRDNAVDLRSGSGSTTLTVKALNLKSVSPITVNFDDGHSEKWDVYVTLSDQASTGSMTITGDATGGTFTSNLNIIPKFNFVKVSGLGINSEKGRTVKVLDFGSPFVQQYLKEQSRLANERIRKGIGTRADEATVEVCQVDPAPTPVPTEPFPTTTTTTTTTTQTATGTTSRCGVKFKGNGRWGWRNRCFCPFPLWELALLARHGVFPFGCR